MKMLLAALFATTMAITAGYIAATRTIPSMVTQWRVSRENERDATTERDEQAAEEAKPSTRCRRAVEREHPEMATVPWLGSGEEDGQRINYAKTETGEAWIFGCRIERGAITINPLPAWRSDDNPKGWRRNKDGSLSILVAPGHELAIKDKNIIVN